MPGRTMTRERARLVEENVTLARRAVEKTVRTHGIPIGRWPGLEWDDVHAVGLEALCESALDYDPSRGMRFGSFAWGRVSNRTIDWFRQAGPRTRAGVQKIRTVSWVDDAGDDWHTEGAPTETLLRDDQLVQDHAEVLAGSSFVSHCFSLLSERERFLLRALLDGRTWESCAEELGVSIDRVAFLRDRALTKLRKDDDVLNALI